jgi:ABC-2 type transport system permease protein
MVAEVVRPPIGQAPGGVSLGKRLFGLGSVFGKSIRDSRRAVLIVGGITGVLIMVVAAAVASQFDTPESRVEIGKLIETVPPILQGLAGRGVNAETLGGYIQYKYGGFFPLVTGLWSILALSGTLATEARRGSLDIVAASPISRRRLAFEKLMAHVLMLGVAMAFVMLMTWAAGFAFAVLPGDEIPFSAAFGFGAWLFLMALAAGAVAFAVAPFLGRGAALAIAGATMFAGFILNGYQVAFPELEPYARLTWFGWTDGHIPLGGQYDWTSLLLVAVFATALFVVGIEAFARRDLGVTGTLPLPRLPTALMGVRGAFGRATNERFSSALTWGIGIGFFGLAMASVGDTFQEQLANSPDFLAALQNLFSGVDFNAEGAFLELVFIEMGLILAGLAAASLVSGWASDETSGRLELLLATPLSKARWALESGLGVMAGVLVVTGITAVGVTIGILSAGGDPLTPVMGSLAVGLYAGALAGVGIAIGGIFGAGVAGASVVAITLITWLLDFLVPSLGLPDWMQSLALSSHIGQPMVGDWNPVGIVLCLALAAGGLLVGTWAFARRDLRG